MSIVKTLIYTFNESQGNVWINTGFNIIGTDTLEFDDVRNGEIYAEVTKAVSEIAVYTGGADVYTTIFRQSRDMNARIYQNYLYVSYNGYGPATNATNVYKIETVEDSFTVIYNSNGGYGTMANQDIVVDTPTPLNPNQFTKGGMAFYGWSTVPDGAVVYTDSQTVVNLAPINESITLYAVWGFPQMDISIQRNNSEKNKLDKDIENIMTLSGTLKNETSIIDPVITVSGALETLAAANYMTIPKFKRKYFITNIRSIRTGIVEISAHVDVLSSFADEIRGNNAIVHKQENEWNLYLNDGTFKVYSDPIIETYLFPVSFPGTFSYVLAVAGGGNSANE